MMENKEDSDDVNAGSEQRGKKVGKRKKKDEIPPFHHLIAATDEQNPFFDFLIPRRRVFSTTTFSSEFNSLLKSSESLGFNETTLIQVGDYRLPPLHWSVTLGSGFAVQELLKNGYNPLLQVCESGHTALHSAALYGPMGRWHSNDTTRVFGRIVPMMSDALFLQDKNLATPLHLVALGVCGNSRVRLYEMILLVFLAQLKGQPERGRELLHVQDEHGNTVLHYLAKNLSVSENILLDLRDFGISSDIPNKEGQTAYDISVKHNNKPFIELFSPDAASSLSTLTSIQRKQPKRGKHRSVFAAHAFRDDREARRRKKPNRYDPTFHDDVPKFLQQEVQKTKKRKMQRQTESSGVSDAEQMDSEESVQTNNEVAASSMHHTTAELLSGPSPSLRVNLSKTLTDDGGRIEVASHPSCTSAATGSSSHAGMSHQELLPLLESLVASGLWKQLTDLATRMKREMEQERLECNRRLEVTASSIVKVKDNLRRCNSEMERLHKEIASLRHTEVQLSEHEHIMAGQLKDIDDKINKLDSFVKQAAATGTNKH